MKHSDYFCLVLNIWLAALAIVALPKTVAIIFAAFNSGYCFVAMFQWLSKERTQ